jgi:ATP-dependent Clp protease ATP-binding subunit ClpA
LPGKAIDLIDAEAGYKIKMNEEGGSFHVTEDVIEKVISKITGIPLRKLDTDAKSSLLNFFCKRKSSSESRDKSRLCMQLPNPVAKH